MLQIFFLTCRLLVLHVCRFPAWFSWFSCSIVLYCIFRITYKQILDLIWFYDFTWLEEKISDTIMVWYVIAVLFFVASYLIKFSSTFEIFIDGLVYLTWIISRKMCLREAERKATAFCGCLFIWIGLFVGFDGYNQLFD